MQDREGEVERLSSSLFSAVRGPCLGSICRLSIGIEDLPRIIGLSKTAASPHKGGTRWNNAIFVEEEVDGDEAAHSDVGKEIKKEKERRLPKVVRRRERRKKRG